MSGPQFAHFQTWSRKSNAAGQSISQVIAEAIRDPEFSTHVENPSPPRVLQGTPATFAADHASHVAARSTVVIMADGSSQVRAIRCDRHTMASIVMSYPVPCSELVTDEGNAKLAAWEKRNVDWLREKYGSQVRAILAHDDEDYPHLHAWLLPDNDAADATMLHPGKVAKKSVEAEAKANGIKNREAVKLGNRALKKAMTAWQDEYHIAVGLPEGLTRSGPKRRRLSRAQWRAEKVAAQANRAALERVLAADARVANIENREKDLRYRVGQLQKIHSSVVRRERTLIARQEAVLARERAAEAKECEFEGILLEAQVVRDEAVKLRTATKAECMRLWETAHEEQQKIICCLQIIRDVAGRIGLKQSEDLIGKDLVAHLTQIEEELVVEQRAQSEIGDGGPNF